MTSEDFDKHLSSYHECGNDYRYNFTREEVAEIKEALGMAECRNRIVPPSITDNNKRSYCMICGENVNENYNYCKKCGIKLKECDNVWMI